MSGIFSSKADSELEKLSNDDIDKHFRVGKNDQELYWRGKRIKRGGFTLTDTILIGIFSGTVLMVANLHNIKSNLCTNFQLLCNSDKSLHIQNNQSKDQHLDSPQQK